MLEPSYTIGEIFRRKLLLASNGKPYTDMSAVSRVVRMQIRHEVADTKYGKGYRVSLSAIRAHNALIKKRLRA